MLYKTAAGAAAATGRHRRSHSHSHTGTALATTIATVTATLYTGATGTSTVTATARATAGKQKLLTAYPHWVGNCLHVEAVTGNKSLRWKKMLHHLNFSVILCGAFLKSCLQHAGLRPTHCKGLRSNWKERLYHGGASIPHLGKLSGATRGRVGRHIADAAARVACKFVPGMRMQTHTTARRLMQPMQGNKNRQG